MLNQSIKIFTWISLHLLIVVYGLFGIMAFSKSPEDDFLNIHKAGIGVFVFMIGGSALAIYSLNKRLGWSFTYAATLGAFYLLLFIVPSALFWLE